eukprot:Ihof_evm12s95 gene=Ihof_evmTU12s95
MGFFGKYVSSQGAVNLLHYKYHGSDDSLLYKHVTSHFINKLVTYIPTWVAPNLITVVGLVFTVVVNLIQVHYSPFMDVPTPRWVYFAAGIALFLYQTFDAMDGKQARKTGTSSPLGLLFDHGCDAINTTVIALSLATTVQTGSTWWTALLWAGLATTFFATTWEEYYTGELHLPIINGPNEGIVASCLVHILTGVFQDESDPFWLWDGPFGFKYNQLATLFVLSCSLPTCLYNIYNVVNAVHSNAAKECTNPRSLSGVVGPNTHLVAFTRIVPALTFMILSMGWISFSPTNMIGRHPRLVLWTLGLILSKLLTGLMLAHICMDDYHPFSKTLAALLVLLLNAVACYWLYLTNYGPMDIAMLE